MSIYQDIESALGGSLSGFRMLVDANIVGIACGDESTIVEANDKFLSIVGYTREDLQHGRINWRAMAAPEYAAVDERAFVEMLATGACKAFEKAYVRKDGSLAFTLVGAALTGTDPVSWISFVLDLSERKESEVRLAALYQREHRIAETLQATLITQIPHQVPGIDIDTAYQPALDEAEVGGDYFDVFSFGERQLALIVGDVSGKGLQAATHTAQIKFALRAYVAEHGQAGISLTLLNKFLCNGLSVNPSGATFFVVMAVVLVDVASGDINIATGGSEPVLIARADGTICEIASSGMALGILTTEKYVQTANRVFPGDIIVMATDGITEARRGGVFLGTDGLADLVLRNKHTDLQCMGRSILQGARTYASGKQHDDVCLLLARIV